MSLAAALSCEAEPRSNDAELEPPAIVFAGCHDVDVDGTCLTNASSTRLHVWLETADYASISAKVDGHPVAVSSRSVAGGLQVSVDIPTGATALRLEGTDPAWARPWTLDLADAGTTSIQSRLIALDRDKADAYERGDYALATSKAEALAALAERNGRRLRAAQAASAAAFLSIDKLQDLERAMPHIEALDRAALHLGEARVWRSIIRGLLARVQGDPTTAIGAFLDAEEHALRLGMANDVLSAREGLANSYSELGRTEQAAKLAAKIFARSQDSDLSCPQRYAALGSSGWTQLMLAQRSAEALDPRPLFEEALELVGRHGECPRWDEEVDTRINLALTALLEEQPAMALAYLERIDRVPPVLRAWVDSARAEAAVALGRVDLFLPLTDEPSPSLSATVRYDRWVVLGKQLESLGMLEAALDRYAAAEAVVDEQLTTIAHDLGRERYITGQGESLRGLVRGLLKLGRPADALCRVRHARGRALRMLDRSAVLHAANQESREAWYSALSEIASARRGLRTDASQDQEHSLSEQRRRRAARRADEERVGRMLDTAFRDLGASASTVDCSDRTDDTMVVALPMDEQWVIFVAASGSVVANVTEPLASGTEPNRWAEQAFAGAHAWIDAAEQIRVLPTGESWDIDWHALPWRGGLLLDVAPVVYSLDLARTPPGRAQQSAVVVADAEGDLPLARQEAESVSTMLSRRGYEVERLTGRGATGDRLVEATGEASLLHYAGHGRHAGPAGWGAHLRTTDREEVGVREILALERVPSGVVLSGCETGRSSTETLDGGMSLATAFVLSGSDWVIATDREVPDALAAAMGTALHEGSDVATAPAAALRAAQRKLASEHRDWTAFRIIVR